ncbi:GDP-L-fucose synthase family protein [Litorimonas sp. RW-G-Af-16]|uniref:GDP-L-fucose synthase family protein n=1 Tax=Litorimonas sp. RW-G-Af-16 TaxID=3241168 RepID=UPI00390C5ADA
MTYSLKDKTIWVAGASGMVGQALVARLGAEPVKAILTPTSRELDLKDQTATQAWMQRHKPDAIIIAAARVGGIHANSTYPAQFLYDNLMIAANVIHSAYEMETEKLLYLGSSCIYPKLAPQPIPESALLTGPLEPTNSAYAVSKIAGIHLCQTYREQYGCDFNSAMPCNLYGRGDNYHPENSHVIPALIRRAHQAKVEGAEALTIWGTGTPLREFLDSDDAADALVHILTHYSSPDIINVGSGIETSISELAHAVCEAVGYRGRIEFDRTKPDGTPRKLMDSRKLRGLGWAPKMPLTEGLKRAYNNYLATLD